MGGSGWSSATDEGDDLYRVTIGKLGLSVGCSGNHRSVPLDCTWFFRESQAFDEVRDGLPVLDGMFFAVDRDFHPRILSF